MEHGGGAKHAGKKISTSNLTLFQGAARVLGQPRPTSLTESTELRRYLTAVWDEDARDAVLEQGIWNFAIRSIKSESDSDVTPDFGFTKAHSRPTDWIRTAVVASDEYFRAPLTDLQYNDEQGYLFTDLDTIYWKYVSNDASYGYDLSLWPQTFVRYVEHFLAFQVSPRLHVSEDKINELEKRMGKARMDAISKDAMNEGIKFPLSGTWAGAGRRGYYRRDRGSRSRLIG